MMQAQNSIAVFTFIENQQQNQTQLQDRPVPAQTTIIQVNGIATVIKCNNCIVNQTWKLSLVALIDTSESTEGE